MKKLMMRPTKDWEVTILKFTEGNESRFKVTRRLTNLHVAETRIFKTKRAALKLFYKWLE